MPRPPHFRERNKVLYRLAHWPIWIFVFFIAPGPLTFDLLERGFDARMAAWLFIVLAGTVIAGWRGRLPGVEPKPYILRFTEDKPNPLYRRVCYTVAWSDLITFALLNASGLAYAVAAGAWRLRQIYDVAYFPLAILILFCGALGLLPRVRNLHERRRNRTALLLRDGVGGVRRAASARAAVETPAQDARGGCHEVHPLRRDSRRDGCSRKARRTAENASHRARRLGGLRLMAATFILEPGLPGLASTLHFQPWP